MKKLKTLFLAFAFLFFTNMQCKKDKLPVDQLPAATQTGANTFGCLVDGQVFIPTKKYIYGNNFYYGYDPAYGLSIEAINEDFKDYLGDIHIDLLIANLTEGQTYNLTDYNAVGKGGAKYTHIYGSANTIDNYETNAMVGGTITITKLNIAKKIISGTFSFKAIDAKSSKIINVTDGRFDLTFK